MILFLDEDRAYLNWVTHHRQGFVLDCQRNPTKSHLVIHRATCPAIKHADSKRSHWTTGKHMKGCSLVLEQLTMWAKGQTEHEPTFCPDCSPQNEVDVETHLTRLDRNILDYVLDIASAHVEDDDHTYSLNVAMISRCFDKSEGQLMAALHRLTDNGLLVIRGVAKPGCPPSLRSAVFPTIKALRTISAYSDLDDHQLEASLAKLGDDSK